MFPFKIRQEGVVSYSQLVGLGDPFFSLLFKTWKISLIYKLLLSFKNFQVRSWEGVMILWRSVSSFISFGDRFYRAFHRSNGYGWLWSYRGRALGLTHFHYCPSYFKKWRSIQKWLKSTQRVSSHFILLNPWHTL